LACTGEQDALIFYHGVWEVAMSDVLRVTKNDYFTYIQDGATEYVFRDSDQVWNTRFHGIEYEIHVSGPNKQPGYGTQYNCFAKKHLMTIKGGKGSDQNYERGLDNKVGGNKRARFGQSVFDATIRGKLHKIHAKRTTSKPWATDEGFTDYTGKRAGQRGKMDASSQAHYQQNALGGTGIGEVTPLTIVLCDLLTPDDLKEAFAAAIAASRGTSGAGTTLPHVSVAFPVDCVYQHRNSDNDFDVGSTIEVSIYLHRVEAKKIEAHVVHCSGV
jgi:hypothetical protein